MKNKRFDFNKYILIDNDWYLIIYNKDKIEVIRTLIDKEDIKKLLLYKWEYIPKSKSVYSRANGKFLSLYRYILNYTGDLVVDHINGNRLDNRKSNLRIVTTITNVRNNIKFRNNIFNPVKKKDKYQVRLRVSNKYKNLGSFTNRETAIKVAVAYKNETMKKLVKLTKFPFKVQTNDC